MMAKNLVRVFLPALVASATVLGVERAEAATPVEIVAVMWQQDVAPKDEVNQFFGCLAASSTFGTTWASQFGLSTVTYRGVYVLSDPLPQTVNLGGNVDQLLAAAFDSGKLPAPSPGGTSYLLYLPDGVQGYDWSNVPACQGTYCGVHGTANYKGTTYDEALVPIHCADCGSVQVTLIGEHEAAEAIANFGTATFEVGDGCQGPSHETMLACCGTQYPIQQLASNQSQSDCQTIDAIGNQCGCAASQKTCAQATDCCAGLSCATVQEQPTGKVCCSASGGTCATRADCCGALQCKMGKCSCNDDGQHCGADADCCNGKCDGATKTCGTHPPPAPDAGSDAGNGGGGDAGNGGGGGERDAGAGGGPGPAPGAGSDASAAGGNGAAPAANAGNTGCACSARGEGGGGTGTGLACLSALVLAASRRRRGTRE
jgi:hypothetical protein